MQRRRKTTNKTRTILLAGMLVWTLNSCQEPIPTHQLQTLPEHRLCADDCLLFTAALPQPDQTYRISFSARLDNEQPLEGWSLEILAEAPSGQTYREVVQLPAEPEKAAAYRRACLQRGEEPALSVTTSPAGNDWTWLYRKNIRPNENGTWNMTLRLLEPESIEGIHCFGFICIPENHEQ